MRPERSFRSRCTKAIRAAESVGFEELGLGGVGLFDVARESVLFTVIPLRMVTCEHSVRGGGHHRVIPLRDSMFSRVRPLFDIPLQPL